MSFSKAHGIKKNTQSYVFIVFFLFAKRYGQTGTGKTFTMEGDRSPNEEFTWEEVTF